MAQRSSKVWPTANSSRHTLSCVFGLLLCVARQSPRVCVCSLLACAVNSRPAATQIIPLLVFVCLSLCVVCYGSVHASWNAYFVALQKGGHPATAFTAPGAPAPAAAPVAPSSVGSGAATLTSSFSQRIMHITRAFQVRGHERAKLDPLGVATPLGGALLSLSLALTGKTPCTDG